MNKLIIYNLLFVLLIRCDYSSENVLLKNTGLNKEVVVVIDDELHNHKYTNLLETIFEKEIDGLPQIEQMFKVIVVKKSNFSRIFQTHKNLIFLEKHENFDVSKNKWAKDQLIINFGVQVNENVFSKRSIKARDLFYEKERKRIRFQVKNNHNKTATRYIKDQFGVEIFIPIEYSTPIVEKDLFIADFHSYNEKQDLFKYIIIFMSKEEDLKNDNRCLRSVDSVINKYVLGVRSGSYAQIDDRVSIKKQNNFFYGIWNLKNGFMGGPILIKRFDDLGVIAIGLICAPNQEKRKHIRILEAVF
ncbi:MAG: hypothetical protein CMP51_02515 [Flavobacteriales bacterium]|nr:hypothetical protein [Flavobacteriales bacterium]|tara:strand:- start:1295 stop:2200 length:906 start_codon:yes stop_codon:yes gene_type:complete